VQFLQGIPRTVTLDSKTDVSLIQWPIEEVNALRGAKLSMTDLQLDAGAVVEVESAAGGQVRAQKIPELKGLSLTSHLSIFYCSNMNFSSGIQKRLIVSNFLKHPSKSSSFQDSETHCFVD
jgi:sucrose-6-phosphate hydrolase SacC (GH32 family)